MKLHAAVTRILKAIPSMEVTDGEAGDSPQLGRLLKALPLDDVETVAADSAYLSRRNRDLIEAIGAKPYIKLKRNSTPRSHGSRAWRNMVLDWRERTLKLGTKDITPDPQLKPPSPSSKEGLDTDFHP